MQLYCSGCIGMGVIDMGVSSHKERRESSLLEQYQRVICMDPCFHFASSVLFFTQSFHLQVEARLTIKYKHNEHLFSSSSIPSLMQFDPLEHPNFSLPRNETAFILTIPCRKKRTAHEPHDRTTVRIWSRDGWILNNRSIK